MSEVVEATVVEPSETVVEENKSPVVISFKDDGLVDFKNQIELSNAAKLLIHMNMAPDHLKKEGVTAVMAALTFCKQFSLPYSAMNELAYIKGKLGAFGALVTALAQRHPDYGETIVLYTDKDMNLITLDNKNLNADVWSCVIKIKKKYDSEWHEYFFTKDEAKTAGLLSNGTYGKYLKDMLFHRAKYRAMSTEYASALKGVYSAEILLQEAQVKDVSPVDKLNEKLGLGKKDEPTVLPGA